VIRALARDEAGTSLIEFALSLPILLTLLLGGHELSDAVACKRKVARAARTVADLASQSPIQTAREVDDLFIAAQRVMAPYAPAPARIRVSQLYTDSSGATTVVWSRGSGIGARGKGDSYPLNGPTVTRDSYVVMSELSYAYTPIRNIAGLRPITFAEKIIMSPRRSVQVACSDC
jgi:Flp pilus assembly protein TadG